MPPEARVLYSVKADSVYKVLMQASDNFIAEQLLMMCANAISDTLSPEVGIQRLKKEFLSDLPDEPIWIDGSGLSRYNLFTPRSIVKLWEKIYARVPYDRLRQVLAVGGESGTIRNYYKAEKPFIVGKTGSLNNNYTLSGFLVTKRGRTLIFSWMNNNFAVPSSAVRARMEIVLKGIYEKY
jgi:D-alanyl-D-alanine carboxypeptidase/D-alanyl-D-alanine-endopeptidase (penicillin-binding protein 4)